MGGGPSGVSPSPTVATEVHSAVAEVACAGLHVAVSAAEKATPFVAEPGSANSVGSDVAAAMAGVFSQGLGSVGSLPVRVCPSDISPATGSLLLEVPRASPVASPVASGGPLEDQPRPKKGGSCRGFQPD